MAINIPRNIVGAMQNATQPAPEAPTDLNNPGAAQTAPTMTPEEMKADIESRLGDVEGKNAQLNAKEITNSNSRDEMREQILRDLFALMEQNGVDPKDPASVRAFLEDLANNDPDLFEIFEMAFDNLAGNQPAVPPTPEAAPGNEPDMGAGTMPGLMGKFNNLAGSVMQGEQPPAMPPENMPPMGQ